MGSRQFVREGKQKVTVITAYRVCKQADPGPKTVSTQEHLLLLEQLDDPHICPRQQLLDDLADFVDARIGDGHEVLLMIDANEDLEEAGPWKDFVERCNLYDLLMRQNEEAPIPPSRENSTRRIDYIMGTQLVYDAVVSAGADQINSGVTSDHRIFHVDLHEEMLFGKLDKDAEASEARKLQSKRPDRVGRYKSNLWRFLRAHKVKERAEKLFQQRHHPSKTFHKKLEALDRDVTRAMLSAKKQLGHYPFDHLWSPEVQEAYFHVRFWQLMVSQLRTSRDMTRQLENIKRQMTTIPVTTGMTLGDAKSVLRKTKTEFVKKAGEAEEARDQALENRAKAYELAGQGEKAKILRNLRRIERCKQTFKKLKRIFKEPHSGRLTSVLTLKEKEQEEKPDEWV